MVGNTVQAGPSRAPGGLRRRRPDVPRTKGSGRRFPVLATVSALVLCAAATTDAQSAGQSSGASSGLPGGASSLNETYRDWQVACTLQENQKRCVLSQVQAQQNGQRVLAIELNAPTGGTLSGTLVLPFGLALDSGVIFQVDEKPPMQPVRFRTCLPVGCLVSVSFDAPALSALRDGATLKVKATADGGAATPFAISLQGFGIAVDRAAALSR